QNSPVHWICLQFPLDLECTSRFTLAADNQSRSCRPRRQQTGKETSSMDRVQRSEETYRKLCGDRPAPMAATNPEMQDILNRFIFGEVFYQGSLDEQHRELITIVVLAASQCLPQLRSHV